MWYQCEVNFTYWINKFAKLNLWKVLELKSGHLIYIQFLSVYFSVTMWKKKADQISKMFELCQFCPFWEETNLLGQNQLTGLSLTMGAGPGTWRKIKANGAWISMHLGHPIWVKGTTFWEVLTIYSRHFSLEWPKKSCSIYSPTRISENSSADIRKLYWIAPVSFTAGKFCG